MSSLVLLVQAGSECPAENPCSDFCLLVGGTPVCSCTRGYVLGSDGATCEGEIAVLYPYVALYTKI